ncbi:MAG: hypothetical protein M3285_04565 [Actinomycetota bacterium]|nr:hypothetical protein [Actinomycetota bacterium]MDQ3954805.1 hypothetical protein [Actinomycetota bacterium]
MHKSTRGPSVLLLALLLVSTVAVPASAGPLDAFIRASISVSRSFDATFTVSDTRLGASYTIAGTATGAQQDVPGTGVVVDACFDLSGNPATCSTKGGFDPTYAVGVFDLTWTGVLGSSGNFVRTCAVVGHFFICTPEST